MSNVEVAIAEALAKNDQSPGLGGRIAEEIAGFRQGMQEASPGAFNTRRLLEYFVRHARSNSGARQTTDIFNEENMAEAIKEAECLIGGLVPLVEWSELSDDAPGEDIDMSATHPDIPKIRVVGKTYHEVDEKFREALMAHMEVTP
jgi:hypothetical protein